MEIISIILTSSLIGSLVTIFISHQLEESSKNKLRDYEIKRKVYIEISDLLNQFMVKKDEKKTVDELHKILGELFMLAPDKVIEGIKNIWEDKDSIGGVKGENVAKLWLEMRRDLIPSTKMTKDDFFSLEFPKA